MKVLSSLEAWRQWNWCTGLGACCRIQWYEWERLGIPSCTPQPPSTLAMSLCIRTWEASTLSSSVHRSTQETCGSHGTRIHAIYTHPYSKYLKKKKRKKRKKERKKLLCQFSITMNNFQFLCQYDSFN